jgi:hypothetical protein
VDQSVSWSFLGIQQLACWGLILVVKIIDQTSCTRLIRGFPVFVADVSAYYAEAAAAGQATTCSHLCKFFFNVILARFHSTFFSSSSSSLSLSWEEFHYLRLLVLELCRELLSMFQRSSKTIWNRGWSRIDT